jgi:hypothetical protein
LIIYIWENAEYSEYFHYESMRRHTCWHARLHIFPCFSFLHFSIQSVFEIIIKFFPHASPPLSHHLWHLSLPTKVDWDNRFTSPSNIKALCVFFTLLCITKSTTWSHIIDYLPKVRPQTRFKISALVQTPFYKFKDK